MPTSDASIANLALQKLGSARITLLSDDSEEAKAVNACYELLRDKELRTYLWNFAKTRVILAPSAVAPEFTFTYAFPLPADCLRVIKPARTNLDWTIEEHEGVSCILTNDGDSLNVRYIKKVTDPARYDPCFIEMLACKIAWNCCEALTQSNTKKAAIMEEYAVHKAEARRTNAFESPVQEEPEATWLVARQHGNRNWLRFGDQ